MGMDKVVVEVIVDEVVVEVVGDNGDEVVGVMVVMVVKEGFRAIMIEIDVVFKML